MYFPINPLEVLTMKTGTIFKFLAAVLCCFAFGCVAAGSIYLYDLYLDAPAPLVGGQTIDFSAYGFTLTVPDGFALNDYTTNNAAEGDDALFAGCAYGQEQELYIFCYENAAGDRIGDHSEQEIISYYMTAGMQDVRTRTFGGRRFICWSASIQTQEGYEVWDTYETWDEGIHLVFETRMNPADALSILQTLSFSAAE